MKIRQKKVTHKLHSMPIVSKTNTHNSDNITPNLDTILSNFLSSILCTNAASPKIYFQGLFLCAKNTFSFSLACALHFLLAMITMFTVDLISACIPYTILLTPCTTKLHGWYFKTGASLFMNVVIVLFTVFCTFFIARCRFFLCSLYSTTRHNSTFFNRNMKKVLHHEWGIMRPILSI